MVIISMQFARVVVVVVVVVVGGWGGGGGKTGGMLPFMKKTIWTMKPVRLFL